jgi:hypothetical protein
VRTGSTVEINLRSILDDGHASRICYMLIWIENQIDGCDPIWDERILMNIEAMLCVLMTGE